MSRSLLLAFGLLLAAPLASAQRAGSAPAGALTGRVVDASTGEPLPFASVAVWRAPTPASSDTTLVTGGVTDADGAFRIDGVPPGRYDVVASYVGYGSRRIESVDVSRPVDLGTVQLAADAAALAAVEVAASRTQVQVRIDRTVYDTADDAVSEGGSASDVLSTLPSVDVDVDGNVSLRGAGNVAVLINGRPAPVSGEFLASYLQSLPAGSVDRVEVIPNPSAAYEPDGMGGIINIVLRQDADPGLGGTLTAGADTQGGYDASGAVTYGSGPWTVAATYGYRESARSGFGTSYRINRYASPLTTLDQNETSQRSGASHLLNLSADYALSRRTVLTSQLQLGLQDGLDAERNVYLQRDAADLRLLEYERLVEEEDGGRSADLRLGLRQTFGEGHTLTVESRLDGSVRDGTEAYTEQLLDGSGLVATPQRTEQGGDETELALQVDYTRPLAGFRLDAGYRGDRESLGSTFVSESLRPERGVYAPDTELNNAFNYTQAVHAAYLQLGRQWGPLGLQTGVRYENARTRFDLRTTDASYDNDYASFFPSAFLSFAPAEGTTLKASYSRRVNRPRTRSLNPFPSYDDPLNLRVGNPFLKPEYVDAFEAGVVQFVPWGTVTLTPYYRHTTDIVRRTVTLRDDGVTVRTSENLDTSDSYGVELIGSFEDLLGGLRGYVSLEGFRVMTDGTAASGDLSNDAFGWGGRLNASYALGDRLGLGEADLQVTGRYSAPLQTEQGRVGARSGFDIALRQKLLDNHASLTLQARDPFGLSGFAFTLDQPTLYQSFERNWGGRQVDLTFAYTFGRQDKTRDRDGRGDRNPESRGGGEFEGGEF